MPKIFSDPDAIADDIIRDVGKKLVVGLPLGLGKANHVINALFRKAVADRSLHLTIFTALTLEKPNPSNDLERRFIGPVIERLFGGYPDFDYANTLHAGRLPANIRCPEKGHQRSLCVGLLRLADDIGAGRRNVPELARV